MSSELLGRVCLVTGASRGIGKGCAKALAEMGATVYITGRNKSTLQSTASELGKNCKPIVCDHSDEEQIKELFKQIEAENSGRLDFLINNCYAAVTLLLGKENTKDVDKFWEQDPLIWDQVNNVGLRANYISSVYAARLMVPRGTGVIVNISSFGGLSYLFNAAYGIGKAAQDRMSQDLNTELCGTGVYALAVWPPAVKTELIQKHVINSPVVDRLESAKRLFSNGTSCDWVGRTVSQLVLDANIARKAGRVIWCNDIADEYQITENDGTIVPSHRSIKANLILAGMDSLAVWIPQWINIPYPLFNLILLLKGNKF